MKNILVTTAMAVACMLTGCKTIPSEDQMSKVSVVVGKAAGYAAQTYVKKQIEKNPERGEKLRTTILEISSKISENIDIYIPGKDETFYGKWMPIANSIVDQYVSEGKLDDEGAAVTRGAFTVVCQGLDYLVSVRYKQIKEYENLVLVGAEGFMTGFQKVFKPVNALSAPFGDDYDPEAYNRLTKNM